MANDIKNADFMKPRVKIIFNKGYVGDKKLYCLESMGVVNGAKMLCRIYTYSGQVSRYPNNPEQEFYDKIKAYWDGINPILQNPASVVPFSIKPQLPNNFKYRYNER